MGNNFLYKTINIKKQSISLPVLLWFLISIVAAIAEMSRGESSINKYLIFKGVFEQTIHQQNL